MAKPMRQTFTYPQKALFKHCDPAGIVFYPRFFEMMNDCVEAFFAEIGHPFEQIHRSGAVPTVNIEAQFLRPCRHGDSLALRLQVIRVGSTSLTLAIATDCNNELRMRFVATLVQIEGHGQPIAWPQGMRDVLSLYLKDED